MPIGKYPDFDACVKDQIKQGKTEEAAKRICGALEQRLNKSSSFKSAKAAFEEAKKRYQDHAQVANTDLSAKWSAVRKNDLPDAAFAYVEPGGDKERVNGKTFTKPRSKRHLPHHTGAVRTGMEHDTVDKPHLRNALARLEQTDLPSSAQASARRHLVKHAKALKIGDYEKKEKK
jgi:hypothetical protein